MLWKAWMASLRSLVVGRPSRRSTRPLRRFPAQRARPTLEALEQREMLSVTPHGGLVLPNVEVQALYYGSNWFSNQALSAQQSQLNGFLKDIVNSSYMEPGFRSEAVADG
jgi:hypothetical protein